MSYVLDAQARLQALEEKFGFHNPNPMQVNNLVAKRGELRGLLDKSGVYVWPAMDHTHHDAAKELGLDYNVDNRLHIKPSKDEPGHHELDVSDEHLHNAHKSPLRSLLRNSRLLVSEPGHDKVTGPEFLHKQGKS